MHWKTKATIQNAISLLPSSLSYATYYWVQRHFGALRTISPITRLKAGIETCTLINELGIDPKNKTFLEVGTGRVPITPLAYWLMGAKRIFTIDLNPYLKDELIRESIDHIRDNANEIRTLFGSLLIRSRLDELLAFSDLTTFSTTSFLEYCNIQYIAPGNAAATGLKDQSIDFHTSHTVFEHIPPTVLKAIIEEGNRITRRDGIFIHRIDYSDHFSYSDKTISAINFLQYSDSDWGKYADNRYMYMNRLRHDDFLSLLDSCGHQILLSRPDIDKESLSQLKSGTLKLDEKYRSKSLEVLSITGSWIASQCCKP